MTKTKSRDIIEIIESASQILKTAKKGHVSIKGNNPYAKKFVLEHAEARKEIKNIRQKIDDANEKALGVFQEIADNVELFFNSNTLETNRNKIEKEIYTLYKTQLELELQKEKPIITNDLFPTELLKNTRGYLEKIGAQAAGAYDNDWFDASAVMIRRLLETLIIECFEAHHITNKIKNGDGNFLYLEGLISKFETENSTSWNLSRNCRNALPELKKIGDQSAHSRFFLAKKPDIDKIKDGLRIVVEELLIISKLKK